jgi:arylsulfatase A-like enzyme
LFSGCWPHTHGIRDNYISDDEARLDAPMLPQLLKQAGYRTAAVSDWCGSDLDKFPFGFEHKDLPSDQWNLKFFLRQGPKDLRLFLSLFCHNRLGKRLLPEVHYLAGVPLNRQVGRDARVMLRKLAKREQPFLLNVFMAATHPPFGSEHPYYMRYADPAYVGESKFVMARLTDPWEILRRQADPKESFDLDQVIDLYDGCVTDFDDQVGKMLAYLDACGLRENTLVGVYSDHGFEFFEHGTWGQGNSAIGDVSARIPLILSGPGVPPDQVSSQIVRSVDLAPTLLELAGQRVPDAMEGTSLLPHLRDMNVDLELPAFNETGMWLTRLPVTPAGHLHYPNLMELLEVADKQTGTLGIRPEYRETIVQAKDRMIRMGRWKLTYEPMDDGPRFQLFDLAADPDCRTDLAAHHADVAERLKAQLLAWLHADPLVAVPATGKTGTTGS